MSAPGRCLSVCAVVGAAVAAVRCSAPAPPDGARATDIVIECVADDIHQTFRISPAERTVDDVSVSPAKHGVADVSDTEFFLQFHERRDNYDLQVHIHRATGKGTRRLFDDEQQPIKGHGGTDDIVCTQQPQ